MPTRQNPTPVPLASRTATLRKIAPLLWWHVSSELSLFVSFCCSLFLSLSLSALVVVSE